MGITNWLMVILTLAYVITTICILVNSTRQFKENLRPRVYVDFRFEGHEMYVVIKNFGDKAAYNIIIKFTPDIEYQMGGKRMLNDQPFIKNLPFLSPQNELDSIMGLSSEVLPLQNSKEVRATINYKDEKDNKYNENYFFSWEAYSRRNFVSKRGLHEIATVLEEIKSSLKRT
ncbi:MAG: hypothetical protein C4533_05920 [Candidatus Omnitrophota bacterium]|jgi:hypothetical protein|nr:MAG: hypothetical protein C4533_05920 [Candidatus Omnitrophota bacterium]